MSVATDVLRPVAAVRLDRPEMTPEVNRIPRLGWSIWAAISACLGVLSVAGADIQSRESRPDTYVLFWLGIGLIFLPTAWQLCRRDTTRNERLVLALVLGVSLYLVKCLYSPTAFVFHDEFAHLRTIINLRNSGHLFGWNPEIRVAADFPGLAVVTLSLVKVSGLSVVTSGMIVIGVGRLLLMLSVFLLLERLTGSPRAAGIGCLIYAGNANFLYWSAQFAYESLALPLALAVAYLLLRRSDGTKRELVPALLVAAMVVITHHLTAYALFALLVAWSIVVVLRRRRGRRGDYAPHVPALLLGAGAGLWLGLAAPQTLGYLLPVIGKALGQGVDLLLLRGSNRALFANPGGPIQPVWEQATAIASVAIIVVFVVLELHGWRRRGEHPLTSALAWTSTLYLLILPLRFTIAGQEAANRSGEFLFVGIGVVLATMLIGGGTRASHARNRGVRRWHRVWNRLRRVRTATAFVACVVIFTGGIAVSWSYDARLPPPPSSAGVPTITTPDDIAAAQWFLGEYGPNHRLVADITTGLAFATYGDQNVLSGASDGAHVWRIFFPSTMTPTVYGELVASRVEFVVVQKRLTESVPSSSVTPVFDLGEPTVDDLRPSSVASQAKFVTASGFSMVYRSATITIYRVDQGQVRAASGSG